MIVGVTLAEKLEREKEHTKQKAILGYDPEKWPHTEAKIRDEEHYEIDYVDLKPIPPTKGNHKFAYCQDLYEEVHAFLEKRKWAPIRADIEVAGTSWIEVFALFDLAGNRSTMGQHQKNPGALKRAEKRARKARCARNKKLRLAETIVIGKPTFDEEIKLCKAVVRHIAKYEAEQGKAGWFQMDNRANLRRLNDLGVNGHQPAIKAFCQATTQEKEQIVEAILKQEIANNKKADITFLEHRERQRQAEHTGKDANNVGKEAEKILLRKTRIAIGATVKWERKYRGLNDEERQAKKDNDESSSKVRYASRLIVCARCGSS